MSYFSCISLVSKQQVSSLISYQVWLSRVNPKSCVNTMSPKVVLFIVHTGVNPKLQYIYYLPRPLIDITLYLRHWSLSFLLDNSCNINGQLRQKLYDGNIKVTTSLIKLVNVTSKKGNNYDLKVFCASFGCKTLVFN